MNKKLSALISSRVVQPAGITPHLLCMRPASLPQPGKQGTNKMVFVEQMKKRLFLLSFRLLFAKPGGSLIPPHPCARPGGRAQAHCCWDGTFPAAGIPSLPRGRGGTSQTNPAAQGSALPPVLPWRCSHPGRGNSALVLLPANKASANPKRREGKGWFDPSPLCNPPTLPAGSTFTSSCCCGQQEKKKPLKKEIQDFLRNLTSMLGLLGKTTKIQFAFKCRQLSPVHSLAVYKS